MDHIRIAIRDSTDSMNICFLDNKAGIKFHEATLQRFLKGTCNFLTLKFYGKDIDTIYPGCRLAFKYADNDYWLTINSFEKNGYECSLTAYSLSLETNKEKRKAYKAPKWTFKQYLDYIDPEHSLTLGLNEVASQSIQLEWSGTDTILARLFSIANSFGAELEFVTELNDDYSLKRHILNVYKVGNIGKDKTGMPIRVGKSLKVINYTANIDELYTAIRVHGKDGLTIAGLNKKVYDSDKKLLYYTQGDTLYAPQARDRFPAIAHKASDSFICLESEDTEHSSKESLYAYMLGELKKHSEPKIDYETEGYVDGQIGDRMLLIDSVHYDPPLYVEARISEQTISLLDKSKNKTVFTNYERKKSEIANELLAKMNALIEENKVYDVQIMTSNGYSFKNGFGETTLTARVMDGPKDVTNEFNLTWFKNSTEYSHDASIIVRAGSIDELATYLIIAEKDGRERGRNELTVFNVKDGQPGKTPVVHLAWADSADGSVGFSLELPTTKIPKYRGYYVDYSSVASTNPKVYKWERNPDDAAKVADEAKDKADAADNKADSAIDTANSAKDTADEASKQTALVNGLANAAKELADKAKADAAEANRLIGLTNTEISKLNTNVNNVRSDLSSAETELNSKIETVKTTLTQNYATKTNLSETQLTLNKTITDSVASVKQEMSEKYAVKSDLTTLQGEYNSFKEETAKKISQQVSSIETVQTNTTEAQKLAGDAYNKAQSAAASATNASSTANSALDKASNATNVANSASQNATNAVANANSAVSAANTAKENAIKAIADVAALTKTVTTQSTRIDQTSNRIEQVASGVTEVGNRLDNLQVGGRNLLFHSSVSTDNLKYFNTEDTTIEVVTDGNIKAYKISAANNTNAKGVWCSFNDGIKNLLAGRTYTYSFWLKSSMDDNFAFDSIGHYQTRTGTEIHVSANQVYKPSTIKANVWTKVSVTFYVTKDCFFVPYFWFLQANQVIYVYDIMLEEGNTPTTWSPAPEDQQSQIDGINNNLSNNYYQKTTVDSKLSTAVSGITAQYTQDINTKLGNYYDKSTIDSKLTIDGQGIATYVKSTKSKLDNLQVGGTNLLRKSAVSEENLQYFKTGNATVSVATEGNLKYYKIRINDNLTTKSNGAHYLSNNGYYNLLKNKHYIFSYWIKVNKNYPFDFSNIGHYQVGNFRDNVSGDRLHVDTNRKYSVNKLVANTWTKVSIEFDMPCDGYFIPYFWYATSGMEICVYDMMLEEGNTPSSWQPAPEDMATLTQYTEVKQLADRISSTVYDSSTGLTTKVNQLAGKYAITALNSAGDILASLNLNANTSTAEINAKLIRLNGSTKMDDAFVNKLVANSILTNKIKATEISGDVIKGGTIQGATLKSTGSGAEPGEVEVNDGTIAMEKQEVGPSGRYFNRGFVSPLEMTMSKVGPVGGKVGLIRATSFTPFGLHNQALDTGNNVQNHRLFFHYQGLSIESDGANSELGRNSGLKIFGDNAYIDLKSGILNDPGNDSDPIKMRIIATPNNTFEFRNNYGNIYMFTKNGENPVSNGYKIPYTFADGNMGIRVARIANPTSSGAYLELSNMAGKAWGVSMWASDQRLKSNIQSPTQDALNTLNQLQVRQFDWKSDNVHEDFGLIAQEVEEILPNAVFKVGDYYQIKDSGLIPVLIGAVQKLSKKVNLLESIIYNTKGGNLL
ncbi:tail fiber domain-containing protein [Enterococcus cecorum]|uniref:tail fiber domain-containing protein n=2 Tax=Enterococcus cecorum TaxID=44008 RepID=UPI002ACAEF7D|nr:tail fiber domain-containing protein [Enterococcus cecorum]MDZ5439330.1 tail fiber domain-containing protein [Enterococcus cecorum]MDZ5497381.1 tail fiber domain-containing protein [Enterococcus cecorum]